MTSHTPGPWTIVQSEPSELTSRGFTNPLAIKSKGGYIAVLGVDAVHFQHAAANARLIAAAPDLLQALELLVKRWEDRTGLIYRAFHLIGQLGAWSKLTIEAREAIAKATDTAERGE